MKSSWDRNDLQVLQAFLYDLICKVRRREENELLIEVVLNIQQPHSMPRWLTARELEVVSAVAAGYTNRDIAQQFSISEDIVKHHLTNIFDKLRVSNRLELAILAISRGIVSNPNRHLRPPEDLDAAKMQQYARVGGPKRIA